jgi:undecaprenyl-diphosphatase
MSIVQAVVLGAVQGLTEFLPISSSGHLIVIPRLLHWPQQSLEFDLILHLATLLAVVIALRSEIMWLIDGWRQRDPVRRVLVGKLLLATVPALLVGVVFGDWLTHHRTLPIVAWSLIVWGILLAVADTYAVQNAGEVKQLDRTSWIQAIVIGVLQVFAFIPGTSRSGATMTAGLFAGLDRPTAAKFSFLLSVPVIVAAGGKAMLDVAQAGLSSQLLPLLIGFVSALVFGVLAIKLLLKIVTKTSFLWFAGYRIALGIFLLTML